MPGTCFEDFLSSTGLFPGPLGSAIESSHTYSRPFPDKDTPRKYDRAYVQTGREFGKVYMAGVSPCFFAHFPWKNWVYPDMALLVKRFQELVELQPEFIQIISWNGTLPNPPLLTSSDWGESHYIGKLQNEAGIPDGAEKWITGFNHEPWREICKYFIKAYRSGGHVSVDVSHFAFGLLMRRRTS